MAALDSRLERDFCARGFIRAAQYFANMLADISAAGYVGPDPDARVLIP